MVLSDLPLAKATDLCKVFRRSGNHITLTHPNAPRVTLSIPNHKEVKRTLLHKQILRAGRTDEEFRKTFDSL
jgi:predicted RNA binding protein YcfA (HicA-like mRNA interferase family)